MKQGKFLLLLCLAMGLLGSLRSEDKVINDAGKAILYIENLKSMGEKIRFLLSRGRESIDGKKYKDTREIAEYILKNLDSHSVEAKDLLAEAKQKEKILDFPQINPVAIPLGK